MKEKKMWCTVVTTQLPVCRMSDVGGLRPWMALAMELLCITEDALARYFMLWKHAKRAYQKISKKSLWYEIRAYQKDEDTTSFFAT